MYVNRPCSKVLRRVQVVCLATGYGGSLTLHIILLLRLFRMWRVIRFAEVHRPSLLALPGSSDCCTSVPAALS